MKNKITGTFLTVMLLASLNAIQAQDKCKFVAQGKDPITGISYKIVGAFFTHRVPMVFENEWIVNIEQRGDQYILASKCENEGIFEDKMLNGDSLILKLDNDKTITLYASKVKEPLHHSVNSTNLICFTCDYAMKKEDVELLTSAKVLYARVNFGAKMRTEKIKEKDALALQKGASCLLK